MSSETQGLLHHAFTKILDLLLIPVDFPGGKQIYKNFKFRILYKMNQLPMVIVTAQTVLLGVISYWPRNVMGLVLNPRNSNNFISVHPSPILVPRFGCNFHEQSACQWYLQKIVVLRFPYF